MNRHKIILKPTAVFDHDTMCGNTRHPYTGCCIHLDKKESKCNIFKKQLSYGRCSNRFPNKCKDCIGAEIVQEAGVLEPEEPRTTNTTTRCKHGK